MLILCIDSLENMRRFTNQPWTLGYLMNRLERESLNPAMTEEEVYKKIGIPLWNIRKDYELGLLSSSDKVVLARGSRELRKFPYGAIVPEDGKASIWGHGYRAGLSAHWIDNRPVGMGRLQYTTDSGDYAEEDVDATIRNIGRFLGDMKDEIRHIRFYSCGSGGRLIGHGLYSYSFADIFQRWARQYWENDRLYVTGMAGAFTKRYSAAEWTSECDGHGRMRHSIRHAYFSIYEEDDENNVHTKRAEFWAALGGRGPASDEQILNRYLAKVDDHELGAGRNPLSGPEREILQRLYLERHTSIALLMPHGFLMTA